MKLLLLSDATMCANGGGIAQTLYNIFSYFDTKNLLCITPNKIFKSLPPTEPFEHCYITYNFEVIDLPRNNLTKFFLPLIDLFNYNYNNHFRKFKYIKKQILLFKPDVVVSCSNGPVGLLMHHKLIGKLKLNKVYPYFMDDWMFQNRANWLNRKIFKWTLRILSENPSWLIISTNLALILQERYNVQPGRVLEIHNPVDLTNQLDVTPIRKKQEYTFVYAGALWAMHFDAFYTLAKGIKLLNVKERIKLVVYTTEHFWNWRKAELEPLGVIYGGCIPYNKIHEKLTEADALILTSSFSKEWYTHSKGSLQTKITDYLKAKRIIISCGPSYSANHNFIKRANCGICIESNDEVIVAKRLNFIINRITQYQKYIDNGSESLKSFSKEIVQKKLQEFLSSDIDSNIS